MAMIVTWTATPRRKSKTSARPKSKCRTKRRRSWVDLNLCVQAEPQAAPLFFIAHWPSSKNFLPAPLPVLMQRDVFRNQISSFYGHLRHGHGERGGGDERKGFYRHRFESERLSAHVDVPRQPAN